jgi:superfamily II DNA/RNA helicase
VINYGLPMKAEDYVHRIGRTGRAGRQGLAVTLAERRDLFMIKRIQQFTTQQIPVGRVAGLEPQQPEPRIFDRPATGAPRRGGPGPRRDGGFHGQRDGFAPRRDAGFQGGARDGHGPKHEGFGPKREAYGQRDGFAPKRDGFPPRREGAPQRDRRPAGGPGFAPRRPAR